MRVALPIVVEGVSSLVGVTECTSEKVAVLEGRMTNVSEELGDIEIRTVRLSEIDAVSSLIDTAML